MFFINLYNKETQKTSNCGRLDLAFIRAFDKYLRFQHSSEPLAINRTLLSFNLGREYLPFVVIPYIKAFLEMK